MSKEERARQLARELIRQLVYLDSLGAPVAAAHLDMAIDALCKEFNFERHTSVPD